MRPALAFKDERGLPLLIFRQMYSPWLHGSGPSQQRTDSLPLPRVVVRCEDRPAHAGARSEPLPHIGWVLMDSTSKLVASQAQALM